ncbi:MAG: NfeD family protein [Lentimicrobiaceae bacterium]|nr:NfeD family protein [Lentimicrobiaceae bacterium]
MDYIESWQVWLIVAAIFVIVEIFSISFVFLCFSLGCIFSAVSAYFGLGSVWQVLIFSVVTFVSFFTVRPLMRKYAFRKSSKVKTNSDAVTGQKGRVTETIDLSKNTGRVFVYGDDWKAVSENHQVIPENELIEVVKVDSTTLIVKQIKKEDFL